MDQFVARPLLVKIEFPWLRLAGSIREEPALRMAAVSYTCALLAKGRRELTVCVVTAFWSVL